MVRAPQWITRRYDANMLDRLHLPVDYACPPHDVANPADGGIDDRRIDGHVTAQFDGKGRDVRRVEGRPTNRAMQVLFQVLGRGKLVNDGMAESVKHLPDLVLQTLRCEPFAGGAVINRVAQGER